MANTRQSTKRAAQNTKRQEINLRNRSTAKSAIKKAVDAFKGKDLASAKAAYMEAVKALSKAASKGAFPKARSSRKISRLTLLAKKSLPEIFKTK